MDLVKIDVIGSEPPQTVFAGFDQMLPRRARPIGPRSEPVVALRRQHNIFAPRAQRLPQHFFGLAERINIGGIEHIDAGLDADLHLPPRLLHLHVAHGGKTPLAAHRHRAHAQHRNFQSARAQ